MLIDQTEAALWIWVVWIEIYHGPFIIHLPLALFQIQVTTSKPKRFRHSGSIIQQIYYTPCKVELVGNKEKPNAQAYSLRIRRAERVERFQGPSPAVRIIRPIHVLNFGQVCPIIRLSLFYQGRQITHSKTVWEYFEVFSYSDVKKRLWDNFGPMLLFHQ